MVTIVHKNEIRHTVQVPLNENDDFHMLRFNFEPKFSACLKGKK